MNSTSPPSPENRIKYLDRIARLRAYAQYEQMYPQPVWAKSQRVHDRVSWDVCEHDQEHPNKYWERWNPTIYHGHANCCGCCLGPTVKLFFTDALGNDDWVDIDLGLRK